MRLQITSAGEQDIPSLLVICNEMTGALRAATNYPRPLKGLYPNRDELFYYMNEGMLYVGKDRQEVLGGIVLTQIPPDAYRQCHWLTKDGEGSLILRHFMLHPDYSSSAPAWDLMSFAIIYAKKHGMKSIRFHIYENDISTICIFEDGGFRYAGSLDLGFRSYGMNRFRAYELLLKHYSPPRGAYEI